MGIDVEKDCIKMPDGTQICFDQDREAFYSFKKLSMSELNEKAVAAIIRKRCNAAES